MTEAGTIPQRARGVGAFLARADAAEWVGGARRGTTHPSAPPKVLWGRQAGPGSGLLPQEPGSGLGHVHMSMVIGAGFAR